MVGEIRDLETADIAIKAAQTGHMVFSTLHTNDAPSTLTRLMNMGVAPFNIALGDPDYRPAPGAPPVQLQAAGRYRARSAAPRPASSDEELDGSWKPYGPVGCERCNAAATRAGSASTRSCRSRPRSRR
jgi:type IV pilus assembly protein PilB